MTFAGDAVRPRLQLYGTSNAELRRRIWLALRIAPAVLFVLFTIAIPIGIFLFRAVDNTEIRDNLPNTIQELENWTSGSIPDDRHFDALAADLKNIGDETKLYQLARRLNYHQSGYRKAILDAAQAASSPSVGVSPRHAIVTVSPLWNQSEIWSVLHRESGAFTSFFLLSALDLEIGDEGLQNSDPERALYREVFVRTIWISIAIAAVCAILGYPVAYFLANSKSRLALWAMYAVLLPFWTSLLVRTLAWIVIFQKGGVAASSLQFLGFDAGSFLYTRPAVIIGMIHIMLPFMILPTYAVMRGISPTYMRAAMSLGAPPLKAFFTVYLPQSLPGVGAGVLIVIILSLGFYLTPALLGSPNDQLVSYFIAYFTNELVNWNMAAALSVWLLVLAATLFFLVRGLFGRYG